MSIDEELKAVGMLTVSEIMNGQPTDGFMTCQEVNSFESFKTWLDMRSKEMLDLKARLQLDGKDSDLNEWVYSHCAAFNEVRLNFNAAIKSGS